MNKHFYSHLITTEHLESWLSELDVTGDEKKHLLELAHDQLHHAILDELLLHLSETDKKLFLTHLIYGDHYKIWNLLDKNVENVEEKIKKVAFEIKKQLKRDIEEVKRV